LSTDTTVAECLRLSAELSAVSDSARLDIELLLCEVLEKNRSFLFTWPDYLLSASELESFQQMVTRRKQGEPVAHILGHRAFWTLDLDVSPTTLIPRPDTELLVELALEKAAASASILDLGTGTGAVALALASELSNARVSASDVDKASVALAQSNAEKHQLNNVCCFQSNWFSSVEGKFDIIVSNPPYIEAADKHLTQGDLKFEPERALVSGEDGLDDIRIIAAEAQKFLKNSAWLLLEHGWNQGGRVRALLLDNGYVDVETRSDLGGNERVSLGRRA